MQWKWHLTLSSWAGMYHGRGKGLIGLIEKHGVLAEYSRSLKKERPESKIKWLLHGLRREGTIEKALNIEDKFSFGRVTL